MELSRRRFLIGMAATAALSAAPARASLLMAPARTLKFDNLHTGEKLTVTYWEHGKYIPQAMSEINRILRDHRSGDVAAMDPRLIDLLAALHESLDTRSEFQVISGYRSPASNAMLQSRSNGVAKHSLRMEGKAIDIRVPGRELQAVRQAALALSGGGVGYYPGSNFVHLDTGRVRKW